MVRKLVYISFLLSVAGCVVKKKTTYAKERKVTVEASKAVEETPKEDPFEKPSTAIGSKADDIINTALSYSGVRYKFGGTTKKGMDCSGLLYVSFGAHDVQLPRISYQMAEKGKRIRIGQVVKGDLLFFKTQKGRKRINHVGMVVAVEDDEIRFIHASTSRGVIVSSLREGYWNYAFVKAIRIL